MKTTIAKFRMPAVVGALLVSALAASSVAAQSDTMGAHANHQGMAGMMQAMDSNHDGMISADEHAVGAKAMFDKTDANHDGMIDKAEMQAGMKAMHAGHGMMGHGTMGSDTKPADMSSDDSVKSSDAVPAGD